ncbi:hypothetical protein HK103_006405 [Boothiomyces macroporosus]|uniref:Uncharacterized protein n=1 Tax=Boothiomyces macroporosus TaxID=261099 RepID=A0AAD5Y727_9FUNG|nr:hypothetical protein HK103_006405 [Boothiomyces macroporosus]
MSKFTDKIKHGVSNVKRNMTFRKKKEPHTEKEPREKVSLDSESTLTAEEASTEIPTTAVPVAVVPTATPVETNATTETTAETTNVENIETAQVEPKERTAIEIPVVAVQSTEENKDNTTEKKSVAKRKWWVPLTIFGWVGALGIIVYARQTKFFKFY